MKNTKKMFTKSIKILSAVGLFGLVLASFLTPLSRANAGVTPIILNVMASPDTICTGSGQTANLSWTSTGATSLSIAPSIGYVDTNIIKAGTLSVSPTQNTIYTFTATNVSGAYETAQVTVNVTGSCVQGITRINAAQLIDNTFDLPSYSCSSQPFVDTNSGAANAMYQAGITSGCGGGQTYCPNANLIKEDAAHFLNQLANYLPSNSNYVTQKYNDVALGSYNASYWPYHYFAINLLHPSLKNILSPDSGNNFHPAEDISSTVFANALSTILAKNNSYAKRISINPTATNNNVTGTINNSDGLVSDIQVKVDCGNWNTLSFTNGQWTLTNVTPGTHTIYARARGYNSSISPTLALTWKQVVVTDQPPVQNPTVNISADPTSISYNGNTVLTWTSTNVTSCTASSSPTNSQWVGTKDKNGTYHQTITGLTSNTTFTLNCIGTNGATVSDYVSINVTGQQIVSGVLNVLPSSCLISPGQSTCTVTGAFWSTNNATSPNLVDRNTGTTLSTLANRSNSSPLLVWVAYPHTTFDLKNGSSILDTAVATASCDTGSTWNTSTSQCVANNAQNPTVNISADPTSISYNGNTVLTWTSTNVTSCTASSSPTNSQWVGTKDKNGTYHQTITGLTSNTTFTLNCIGTNGATVSDYVSINAGSAQVNGGWSDWSAQSTQCGISSVQVRTCTNPTPANGGAYCVGSPIQPYTTAQCSTSGSSGSNTNTNNNTNNNNPIINIYGNGGTLQTQTCQDTSASNYGGTLPCRYNTVMYTCQEPSATNYRGTLPCIYQQINNQPTVGISADSTNLYYNGATNIRWYTTNASSCYASGGSVGWSGTKSIGPSSFYTGSLTGTRTYTITCTNSYGSASDYVTVNVRGQTYYNPAPTVTPSSYVVINSSVDRNQPIVPTIDNTRPRPGDQINYTVNYQNIGTGSITGLTLKMNLPYEVDYMFSTPNNPMISGNTLTFNLGTLKANGQGTVTVRVRVRDNIPAGTNLNFPATLSYIDPSGSPQSVNANVAAQVYSEPTVIDGNNNIIPLGANVFGAGFLPNNLFGWLLLLVLILVLVLLAKYLFGNNQKSTTVTTTH